MSFSGRLRGAVLGNYADAILNWSEQCLYLLSRQIAHILPYLKSQRISSGRQAVA